MLELAIYAVITIVIVSKLYNVLGQGPNIVVNHSEDGVIIEHKEEDTELEKYPQFSSIVDDILKKDNTFSLKNFVNGAERAFEMIISAINENSIEKIEPFLSEDIYKKLKREIDARKSENKIYQNTLVSIKSKEIQIIELFKNNINITIKFISEQIKLVRNAKTKEVIEGNSSITELIEDVWSFTKHAKSNSSKWLLTSV